MIAAAIITTFGTVTTGALTLAGTIIDDDDPPAAVVDCEAYVEGVIEDYRRDPVVAEQRAKAGDPRSASCGLRTPKDIIEDLKEAEEAEKASTSPPPTEPSGG